MTAKFELTGPHEGATGWFGGYLFKEGVLEVPDAHAPMVARLVVRYHGAELTEADNDTMVKVFEALELGVKAPEPAPLLAAPGDEIPGKGADEPLLAPDGSLKVPEAPQDGQKAPEDGQKAPEDGQKAPEDAPDPSSSES